MNFRTFSAVLLAFSDLAGSASAQVQVQGYMKKDGTYVAPYVRTAPDSTINNNYSTKPNINPYTGKEGTLAPNPYQPLDPAPVYGTP